MMEELDALIIDDPDQRPRPRELSPGIPSGASLVMGLRDHLRHLPGAPGKWNAKMIASLGKMRRRGRAHQEPIKRSFRSSLNLAKKQHVDRVAEVTQLATQLYFSHKTAFSPKVWDDLEIEDTRQEAKHSESTTDVLKALMSAQKRKSILDLDSRPGEAKHSESTTDVLKAFMSAQKRKSILDLDSR